MENIKKELIAHLGSIYTNQDWDFIVCGHIILDEDNHDRHINLIIDGDVVEFLDKLDLDISSSQACDIIGTIWFADGTWSEYVFDSDYSRGFWERHVSPEIPDSLWKKEE
jgi:hypothetical protein